MKLRPAHPRDVYTLAATLRACDREEIRRGSGRDPVDVIRQSMVGSRICEAIETPTGTLAGIWGVMRKEVAPGIGSIWMLGSPELESIPLSFLRACRPAIARAHALYPTLACAAWRENALHLNWLRWLGFTQNDVGHPHFIPHYRHV